MNERIQKLAEQAWKEVLSETSIDGDTSNVYSPDEVVAFEQKFAELIVKECMAIAKNWEDQLESSELLEESNAVGIVAYRIARQFGVKQ